MTLPVKAFNKFPKTCVARMATVNRHPQGRRLNQPVAAINREAPSARKGIPTVFPRGASRLYAGALIAHMRSRKLPRHTSVVPARQAMIAPNIKKMPTAVIPLGDFV